MKSIKEKTALQTNVIMFMIGAHNKKVVKVAVDEVTHNSYPLFEIKFSTFITILFV